MQPRERPGKALIAGTNHFPVIVVLDNGLGELFYSPGSQNLSPVDGPKNKGRTTA